ncbi:hypothetical protein CcaverHIS002_0106240 [Cutaneotrichosporon cavernicola]|uniref:Uncharacterized protein n=1 Tax=Cutaneotrichosporon cavernicola TaxID=279322 RepID=A0AA48I6D9_9TREE|nr:uncharacterized protein CcaverHIS019_0106180 [Cutaneotrichosporon cavernicola]BEI80095.1 hypothetical protein CcaverHIS002_0106240 [Cutaneotrichosporon cavernicola]BEI87900.1 hypothetical protein CcaverHIS019_0106180 [Cutaneotrichosporon cavernicola]BEI95674.1 hypothetical protein CcaverHIS631_0106230 [Cutaneotrichosporon cavernicola]BEJ03448.1 hypothetical protein CcaverHIS641_0106230 [Cutaneotrichosporon cavernicola]
MATTQQPPAEGAANGAPSGPPTLSTITSLPPLPHPLHPRGQSNTEAFRVMRMLGENASNGVVDYPYPSNTEYPLPPLPPIPVPTGTSRRRRAEPVSHAAVPIPVPPIPETSYLFGPHSLESAVKAHNEVHPQIGISIHYDRSALLVHLGGLGYMWCLIRTLGAKDAGDTGVLGARSFHSREARPPPIHAVAPPGPSLVFGEHLKKLHLSVITLLHRLPYEVTLLESPCYRCGKFLSDIDGLPLNASGWIPPSPKSSDGVKFNEKADEEMDVDGDEKKEDRMGEKKEDKKEDKKDGEKKEDKEGDKNGEAKKPETEEDDKEGRWVKWHASCRAP